MQHLVEAIELAVTEPKQNCVLATGVKNPQL